jgi:hypothetical protein
VSHESALNHPSGRVAGLLYAVGFEQAAVGLGRFVVEVDPPDCVDARQAFSDTQPVGDPLGLNQGFYVVVELEVNLGRDRPLGEEQLRIGVTRPAQIAIDEL